MAGQHRGVLRTMHRILQHSLPSRAAHALSGLALLVVAGCGRDDDVCTFVHGPSSLTLTLEGDSDVKFDVDDAPLPVQHQAVMMFRTFGEAAGLKIRRMTTDAPLGGCDSMPSNSTISCFITMDVERGQPLRIELRGTRPGSYQLEGRLVEHEDVDNLLDPPVCSVHSAVRVQAAK